MHARTTRSNVTEPYLDARLAAIEARLDARVQRIEDKMDVFAGNFLRMEKAIDRVHQECHDAVDRVHQECHGAVDRLENALHTALQENQRAFASMRSAMILTGISVVLGLAAIIMTLNGNLLSAFESGKGLSELVSQHTERLQKTLLADPAPTTTPPATD